MEEEIDINLLIKHIEDWNKSRAADIQAIMANPVGEWERGIMLSNACCQDIQQIIKWCHTLAKILSTARKA